MQGEAVDAMDARVVAKVTQRSGNVRIYFYWRKQRKQRKSDSRPWHIVGDRGRQLMQSSQAFGEGLKQIWEDISCIIVHFSCSKSGLFIGKILRKIAWTLSELINNNVVLGMSVSYKFSSHTILHIHKILYFMGDFNWSVWSLPLCHNVQFHHVSHRNRDLS